MVNIVTYLYILNSIYGLDFCSLGNTNTNEQYVPVNQRKMESYEFTLHKIQSVMGEFILDILDKNEKKIAQRLKLITIS